MDSSHRTRSLDASGAEASGNSASSSVPRYVCLMLLILDSVLARGIASFRRGVSRTCCVPGFPQPRASAPYHSQRQTVTLVSHPQTPVCAYRQSAAPRSHRTPAPPSAPVHTCAKFSYLSSERITKMQHSGLINLGIVIILATNSRLILENITKYGLRATPLTWLQRAISVSTSSNRRTLIGFFGLLGCVFVAWTIELLGTKRLKCASQPL